MRREAAQIERRARSVRCSAQLAARFGQGAGSHGRVFRLLQIWEIIRRP